MKRLEECRAYFEDVYMDMLDTYVFSEGSKRLKTFEETLTFIYGDEYKRIAPRWKQDALNKYYSAKYEGVPHHEEHSRD